ncbi:hypothetical protein ARMSODRAFT_952489 [Armillaria solidipes]|uniref:F-box domain-containing protein n=1 Tax=Armillaria solidipes TaxID=1076256 RepID=A0A2H3CB98_9AGAR|nr:hypothetical protein ARMSODRAFT_952489 [Armillaria solidipes]
MMYPQELIDEILDYLHDSPSALKACSLVSHQFYRRTRVHLFREVDCCTPDDPRSAQVFGIARDSPELLQCIKRVQFRCLDFFLPDHQTATVEFLHSLRSPMTLSLWDDSYLAQYSVKECEWRRILPAFVSLAPYLAITRLALEGPEWDTFLEFHHIVLSLPNVTELHIISCLKELSPDDDPVVPAPPAPRIKNIRVDVDWGTILSFWEGLRSYRSVYLDQLEEFHVINPSPDELCAVIQTASLASKNLKVLEIDCRPLGGNYESLPPSIPPLDLNAITDLRLGVELSDDTPLFINWWIRSFKAVVENPPIMERLTIKLRGYQSPVTESEPLERAFEELSDLLSKLVRNVELVFQLNSYRSHPGLCTNRLKSEIVDACEVLKEKANLRVFDMAEYTYDVPVSPFPASTRCIV